MHGPFDHSAETDTSEMLDLGHLFLPNVPGLEVHLDLDPRTGNGKAVSLHLNMSIAEVQVFASAANEDLWGNMRDAIAAGLQEQLVACQIESGRFGTEVRAVMPIVDLDGNTHVAPVRFVGIRGSRWFMRVVISGDGALDTTTTDTAAWSEIDEVISLLVVARGEQPMAPGERLWLRSPQQFAANQQDWSPNASSTNQPYGHVHISL